MPLDRQKHEESLIEKKMSVKEFLYRLFFTREDSLDLLQLLFLAVVVVTLMAVWKIVSLMLSGSDTVVVEALKTLRWLTALLVLTAVPSWLVPVLAKAKIISNFEKEKPPLENEHTNEFSTEN
jgi:hypothetical protein